MRKLDLKGRRFGRLIAIGDTDKRTKHGKVFWLCRCDCGNLTETNSGNLISGNTKSCGCLHDEIATNHMRQISYKHGGKGTRLYRIWSLMKNRCYNKNSKDYRRYGQRGIKVCNGWKNNYVVFKDWALANGYKSFLIIDRIDNDGDYEPKNCQWITIAENTAKDWKERERGKNGRFI